MQIRNRLLFSWGKKGKWYAGVAWFKRSPGKMLLLPKVFHPKKSRVCSGKRVGWEDAVVGPSHSFCIMNVPPPYSNPSLGKCNQAVRNAFQRSIYLGAVFIHPPSQSKAQKVVGIGKQKLSGAPHSATWQLSAHQVFHLPELVKQVYERGSLSASC